mmetsp:Transcript_32174/g.96665  ORF Transcript_32174/g.96665 Transcript_32174/m.96665 type:complete len:417 (+) Transcript_32174:402-1652(+)
MNGCICCTVRGDLVVALKKLWNRVSQFDAVIIETTGLADPAPVAQTFFVDDDIKSMYSLDGIITVCDSKHITLRLDDEKPEGVENEAVEQVAFADRILLNKTDLVDEAELAPIEARIKKINPSAEIFRCQQSNVDPTNLIGIKAFSLDKTLEMDPEFLDTEGEHEHDDSVGSVSIQLPGEVHMLLVNEWIGDILKERGNDIYRMKGVLAIAGSPQKFVYQGVHMIFDGEFDAPWAAGEAKTNKLVFIGKNLDKGQLEREFSACLDSPANRAAINAVEQIKAMERQQSALLGAAQRDDVKALKGIIGSGVDVSAGNAVGQTALHIASLWGNAQAVGVLVQAGADVNKPNEMGDRTPLHMVATRFEKGSAGGRLICAQYLIAAGADLTAKDTEGGMPWEYIVGEEAEAAELRKLLTPK